MCALPRGANPSTNATLRNSSVKVKVVFASSSIRLKSDKHGGSLSVCRAKDDKQQVQTKVKAVELRRCFCSCRRLKSSCGFRAASIFDKNTKHKANERRDSARCWETMREIKTVKTEKQDCQLLVKTTNSSISCTWKAFGSWFTVKSHVKK